jgi:arsenite-transporting ATPase
MRVILYTGKGGVGKTTVSAATAVLSAEYGHRTVVLSTDPAHSLSDAFLIQIGSIPQKLKENLFAQEIDVYKEISDNWGKIESYVKLLLQSQGLDELMSDELATLPGMDELFSLLKILEFKQDGEYDTVIIDCAPTASTIRLLSFPEIFQWYMDKFFNIGRKIAKVIRPAAERLTRIPFPKDEVYASIEKLYMKMIKIKELLLDNKTTTIRLVINPEKMVINESQRAYTYLNMFGFTVDAVIVNKVYPKEINNSYLSNWLEIQDKHIKHISNVFHGTQIFKSILYDKEMVGVQSLSKLAKDLFNDDDPTKCFSKEPPIKITKKGSYFVLMIKMPGVKKEDISLLTSGDELIIKIMNFQRNLMLPRALQSRQIKEATIENGWLKVIFV